MVLRTKLSQTILHLPSEIKTFSRLSAELLMFFPSRVEASYPRVVSHSVDCQHVGSGPGIHRVGVRVAA